MSRRPLLRPPLRPLIALAALVLFAAACGSDGDSEADAGDNGLVFQGEQSVDLPDETTTTAAADESGGGAGEGGAPTFDETEDTIPTDDEDSPNGEFFDAVGQFMSCLSTEGHSFIGLPGGDDETAPTNDPSYTDALGTCAAATQIVDKMRSAQDNSDLTAEEIEAKNRAFGVAIDCMKGRGWIIPDPTPDEDGVLQPSYIEILQTWTPPAGTEIIGDTLNTDDFVECQFGDAIS